jgi:hypothetical protein
MLLLRVPHRLTLRLGLISNSFLDLRHPHLIALQIKQVNLKLDLSKDRVQTMCKVLNFSVLVPFRHNVSCKADKIARQRLYLGQ